MKQTSNISYIRIPDGAKLEVSSDLLSWTDLGLNEGDIKATLNYDRIPIKGSNYGVIKYNYKNMMMAATFTLMNINPAFYYSLAGGMFSQTTTTATPVTTCPDQIIASGESELTPINLAPTDADGVALKLSAAPTIASVTGSTDSTLTVDDDFSIIVDPNSFSGYSIVFNTAGTTLTTMTQTFSIVYTSVTPYASSGITGGSTANEVTSKAIRFTCTDSAGKSRTLVLYACTVDSGGFSIGFKGNDSGDETETWEISITAELDTTRTDKDQLFSYTDTDLT